MAQEVAKVWVKVRKEMFEGISEEDLACFKKVAAQVSANISRQLEK